ncbi:MAG TPA: ectonucleotide pyrophosphatase/phosphodiesterase [Puia sp.]|nr:ectonucleotide pyrophosphatase/phosphodiesterase [Puia sp.]
MLKKVIFLAGVVLMSMGLLRAQSGQPLVKHVVLITIDGSRPDFYLDPSWHADNIRALMAGGAAARGVNSVFPSMTYPSHTTIVTGVQPAKHGVYYNNMYEPNGPTGKMYWNDSSIKVPTVWAAAKQKGMTVAALFWPVSADAPVDYNIPDIGSMGEAVREKYSKPAGFVDELRKNVFGGDGKIEYGRDVNVGKIAAYVIKKAQPNLMTIHFFSVDHNEHMQGRDGDQVRAAVRGADSAVGIIVNALREAKILSETAIIVTGDHGFVDVKESVNPNVWLKRAGLLTDVKTDDWKAQFFSVGGSSYLYLKDRKDEATLKIVRHLLDTVTDGKKLFRVIDRRQMESIGGNPDVEFALSGLNGTSFGNAVTGEAMKPGHGGSHGYFPDFFEIRTGYVINGPGIRKGAVIEEMNQRDQAAIIVKLLGLSLPTAEGVAPAALFAK